MMKYHIYNAFGPSQFRHLWGVEEGSMKKIVEAFLRGNTSIVMKGSSTSVGAHELLIYEDKREEGASGVIIDSLNRISGANEAFDRAYFERSFRNVTDTYLRGMSWGDLKEDYFNIYINDGPNKPVLLVLKRSEVESFLREWAIGNSTFWLGGRRIDLDNPKSIKIFDINFEWLSKDLGSIRSAIKKYVALVHKGSFKIDALEYFGSEVTDKWDIKAFGSMKSKEQSNQEESIPVPNHSGRLFISHSSKDRNLVSKFVDHVLLLGLGMKREDIFCTSLDGSKIKSGDDFRNAIKTQLLQARAVIQIITKNYKASEVCLNEMGAAWVLSGNVIPLVALPFNYDLGFIHANSQQLILNRKEDLLKMYDDHKKAVFPENVNISVFNKAVDDFLKFVEKAPIDAEFKTETAIFYDELVTLKGILREGIFQHPNGSHHRFYFIELNPPVDVLSSELIIEEGMHNSSHYKVVKMQLSTGNSTDIILKPFKDLAVVVKGKCWGGHTAWHQTPVMLTVESVMDIND